MQKKKKSDCFFPSSSSFQADYKEVFTGISNIEEVAFNALSFVWSPTEEAKVSASSSPRDTLRVLSLAFLAAPVLSRA